jgi:hypothetical protein
MRNVKQNLLWPSLTALVCLVSSTARADTVNITAGITSFSGIVGSASGYSTYYSLISGTSSVCVPGPIPCFSPLYGFDPLCPDAGCGTGFGLAKNVPLNSPNESTSTVVFKAANLTSELTPNALSFQTAGLQNDVDIHDEFELGTLSFTNGIWSGNADFGLTIIAFDSTTGKDYTFNGFLQLNVTNNTGNAAENEDYILLTDASGNPVVNPLTGVTLPSFKVYELGQSPLGNSGSVTLYGTTGSLDPTRFADPTGAGFLGPSMPNLTTTPEPAAVQLTILSLLGMVVIARRKHRLP